MTSRRRDGHAGSVVCSGWWRGRGRLGRRQQGGELVGVERVGLGVGADRGSGAGRPQVGRQLVVVDDAGGERLGDPVHLVEQHAGVGRPLPAVAGGGAGDQRVDVRRECRGRRRTAAGTSSWTCL